MSDERIVREAEDFLSSFTTSDLTYRDSVTVGGTIDPAEYVTVATWGAEDELGVNDDPEPWPIRVRVHNADDDEAGVYLSIDEAKQLARELWNAVRRAKGYPQPPPHSSNRTPQT